MMLFGFAGIAAIVGLIFAAVVLVSVALQPRARGGCNEYTVFAWYRRRGTAGYFADSGDPAPLIEHSSERRGTCADIELPGFPSHL